MKKPAHPLAAIGICLPLLITGCATSAPPLVVTAATPAQWQAPLPPAAAVATQAIAADPTDLPHQGNLTDLSQWWQAQGDTVLVRLIDAAQTVNPTLAAAAARITEARATRVATGAALLPSLDASLSSTRASAQPPLPGGTTSIAALQTAWEIDLFGANRGSRDGAQARLDGAQAAWHDARVLVAAEVANQYYSLRACEALLTITRADAGSRTETARLAKLAADAGFQAPATVALASASAAEANGRATQQAARCDLDIKALVYLTALPEPDLRRQLGPGPASTGVTPASLAALVPGKSIVIGSLPAQVLAQRPDIFAAGREVAAASADVGSALADQYPRLTLSGSLGAANFRSGSVSASLSTWSIGPLALTVPLFDGGRRAANVDAARGRYEVAALRYRASVRQAVREVEEALVTLNSTAARSTDAVLAVDGYRASFNATESRYRSGLASLIELEETRRTRLTAEIALVSLQRERSAAWIGLYRAAGGGWDPARSTVGIPGR